MKTKILIITTLVACIAADCRKKDKNRPTYYMSQDFKDYVVFPKGSYWIYEDSTTNQIDSIYLQSQNIEILTPPSYNDPGYDYEYLSEWIYSSYKNQQYSRAGRYNEFIANNVNGSYIYYGMHLLFISNVPIGIGCDNLKYLQFIDSLLIKNMWFKNIKVFTNIGSNGNIAYLKTYFCRNVGLVKMEISYNNDTTGLKIWLLKSYHINN